MRCVTVRLVYWREMPKWPPSSRAWWRTFKPSARKRLRNRGQVAQAKVFFLSTVKSTMEANSSTNASWRTARSALEVNVCQSSTVGQTANVRRLDTHPTCAKVVNQKHTIHRQTTALSQTSGSPKSIRVGITDFEVATHGWQGSTPGGSNLIGSSNQNRQAQSWVPGNAIETLLKVGWKTSKDSARGVGFFNQLQQVAPQVSGLPPLSIAKNTVINPTVGKLQQEPRLGTTPGTIREAKDGDRTVVTNSFRCLNFGKGVNFASQELCRPCSILFSTTVGIDNALQSGNISLKEILPTDSVKASSSPLLLTTDLSPQQRAIDRKVGNKIGSNNPLGKIQKLSPMGEGGLIMATPSFLPLFMKSLKQSTQMTNGLGLNARSRGFNVIDRVQPNLVMISMDDIVGPTRNPKGLVRQKLSRLVKLDRTLLGIDAYNLGIDPVKKGLHRCCRWSGNFTENQVSVLFVLGLAVSLFGSLQSTFKKTDLSKDSIKDLMSNIRGRTMQMDMHGISRSDILASKPPTGEGWAKPRSTQDGIPKTNAMQTIINPKTRAAVNPPTKNLESSHLFELLGMDRRKPKEPSTLLKKGMWHYFPLGGSLLSSTSHGRKPVPTQRSRGTLFLLTPQESILLSRVSWGSKFNSNRQIRRQSPLNRFRARPKETFKVSGTTKTWQSRQHDRQTLHGQWTNQQTPRQVQEKAKGDLCV